MRVTQAKLYPGCVFLIGYDTAIRIVNAKYYGNSHDKLVEALSDIRSQGCRWEQLLLVGGVLSVVSASSFRRAHVVCLRCDTTRHCTCSMHLQFCGAWACA